MNITNLEDIIYLLMRRDHIDHNEAYHLITDVRAELNEIVANEDNAFVAYELAAELLQAELGLEPDYLDILMG